MTNASLFWAGRPWTWKKRREEDICRGQRWLWSFSFFSHPSPLGLVSVFSSLVLFFFFWCLLYRNIFLLLHYLFGIYHPPSSPSLRRCPPLPLPLCLRSKRRPPEGQKWWEENKCKDGRGYKANCKRGKSRFRCANVFLWWNSAEYTQTLSHSILFDTCRLRFHGQLLMQSPLIFPRSLACGFKVTWSRKDTFHEFLNTT